MRFQLLIALMLCLSFVVLAGDKPDFTGTWKLSEEKSTLDQMGAAFLQTKMNIEQSENEIILKKTFAGPDGGEFEGEEKMTLDGKECKSEAWGGSPRVSTATWSEKGDALMIVSKITFSQDGQDSVVDIDESWSLADDKTLSIKHSSESEWGERNITIVFTKVDSK
jgi:hypothetical protein